MLLIFLVSCVFVFVFCCCFVCLPTSCVFYVQCCYCLWIFHSWSSIWFSLTFISFILTTSACPFKKYDFDFLIFGVLTPLSTIFQLYHGDQFLWWRNPEYPDRTTDHGQATGKLYHLRLRVECTFFVIYDLTHWVTRAPPLLIISLKGQYITSITIQDMNKYTNIT